MTVQIPEFTMASVSRLLEEYCLRKVPIERRDQADIIWQEYDGEITLILLRARTSRPNDWQEMPVARFHYEDDGWTLYNSGEDKKWQPYKYAGKTKNFRALLDIMDLDKTGIFWGR